MGLTYRPLRNRLHEGRHKQATWYIKEFRQYVIFVRRSPETFSKVKTLFFCCIYLFFNQHYIWCTHLHTYASMFLNTGVSFYTIKLSLHACFYIPTHTCCGLSWRKMLISHRANFSGHNFAVYWWRRRESERTVSEFGSSEFYWYSLPCLFYRHEGHGKKCILSKENRQVQQSTTGIVSCVM